MSEKEDAIILANKILDRPWADPDDDLAVLSRQLLRALERLTALAAQASEIVALRESIKTLLKERDDMKDDYWRRHDAIKGSPAPDPAACPLCTRRPPDPACLTVGCPDKTVGGHLVQVPPDPAEDISANAENSLRSENTIAAILPDLVTQRDAFIVSKGLWQEFVASLTEAQVARLNAEVFKAGKHYRNALNIAAKQDMK